MTMTIEPEAFTKADGTPYDEQGVERILRYADDVMSGAVFARVAASERSSYGYRPCLSRDQWAHIVTTIGRMAASSDALAQLAAGIVGRVNLYGTAPEARAQVYERAFAALGEGYDDVIRRSGPEPGRPSSWRRDYTLRERLILLVWLTEATSLGMASLPTVGWCADALLRAHRIYLPAMPNLHGHYGAGR